MSLGVLESALIVGALIFTMTGIGKSTPTIKVSPSLNIERIVALLNLDLFHILWRQRGRNLQIILFPPKFFTNTNQQKPILLAS